MIFLPSLIISISNDIIDGNFAISNKAFYQQTLMIDLYADAKVLPTIVAIVISSL